MIIAVNFQFKQLARRSQEKKIRASRGFEPVTSSLPVCCSTNWAMKPHIGSEVNLLSSYLPWGVKWCELYMKIDLAPNVWLYSSVGRATHRQRGGHGFESRWSPDFLSFFFFQASSFQLLKLEIYCDDHSSLNKYKSIKPRTGLYDSDEYKSNFCLYLSL